MNELCSKKQGVNTLKFLIDYRRYMLLCHRNYTHFRNTTMEEQCYETVREYSQGTVKYLISTVESRNY